jgi:cyclopropane fatty-acyl-phospholipid synthase-like methyltransferase
MPDYRTLLYQQYVSDQGLKVNFNITNRQYYDRYYFKKLLPLNPESRILDIGCGLGSSLMVLRDLGYSNLTGIEFSREVVNLLQGSPIQDYVINSDIASFLSDALAEGKQYDAILSIDVFEHFSKNELIDILCLIEKVLAPGGILLIKVPNAQSPLFSGTVVFGDFAHENAVTPSSLSQVLRACGFDKIQACEAAPVPYTLFSYLRYFLWKIVRLIYVALYAVETGALNVSEIWSRSFFVVCSVPHQK